MALRQHHGVKVPLYIRLPPDLRAQLVALADTDRRSLNSFVVMRLEDGLALWLDRQRARRAQDPTRHRTVDPVADAKRQLAEIARELKRPPGLQPPPLPDDLTPKERAMLGMPAEEVAEEPAVEEREAGAGTAGMAPEMAELIDVLLGKRPYVPPGLRVD